MHYLVWFGQFGSMNASEISQPIEIQLHTVVDLIWIHERHHHEVAFRYYQIVADISLDFL